MLLTVRVQLIRDRPRTRVHATREHKQFEQNIEMPDVGENIPLAFENVQWSSVPVSCLNVCK